MTPRHKNMLEAFQGLEEQPSSEETTPPSGADSPTTTSAPKVRRRANSGLPDVAPELFAVVLCVLVAGAFFLGRWSVSTTVRAAEGTPVTTEVDETLSMDVTDRTPTMDGEEPAPWVEPEPTALTVQLPGTVGMLEANSLAFDDMENRRTVRVESYINNESGRREALSEGVYLSSLGFPAMVPVVLGDNIYLCVGAAPSVKDEELLRIMRELRQIPGPPPASEHKKYADSYLYNIDDLIDR